MKIHDALLFELIKPDKSGKPTGDIIKIVGTANIKYRLEELVHSIELVYSATSLSKMLFEGQNKKTIIKEMAPDIIVKRLNTNSKEKAIVAIELETDVDFDFGESLRQIKKYKKEFGSQVNVIIPREYERFAPFYKNEEIHVWLWEAERIWECMICGNKTVKKGPVRPKCENCNKYSEHRLIGLQNTRFEEFSEV